MAGNYDAMRAMPPSQGQGGGGIDLLGLISKLFPMFTNPSRNSPIGQVLQPFPQGLPLGGAGPQYTSGVPGTADVIAKLVQMGILPFTNPSPGSPIDRVVNPGQTRSTAVPGPADESGAPIPGGQGPALGPPPLMGLGDAGGELIDQLFGGKFSGEQLDQDLPPQGAKPNPTPQLAEPGVDNSVTAVEGPEAFSPQGGLIDPQLQTAAELDAYTQQGKLKERYARPDQANIVREYQPAQIADDDFLGNAGRQVEGAVDTVAPVVDDITGGFFTGEKVDQEAEAPVEEARPPPVRGGEGVDASIPYSEPPNSEPPPIPPDLQAVVEGASGYEGGYDYPQMMPKGTPGGDISGNDMANIINQLVGKKDGAPVDNAGITKASRAIRGGEGVDAPINAQIVNVDPDTQELSHQPRNRGYGTSAEGGAAPKQAKKGKAPSATEAIVGQQAEDTAAREDVGYGGGPYAGGGRRNETYTIKKGDSLYKIAQRIYGDGNRWREIAKANGMTIKNPNKIYAGRTLVVPGPGGAQHPTPRVRPGNKGRGDR